ncbi:unnamed protein product [Natator depressus]
MPSVPNLPSEWEIPKYHSGNEALVCRWSREASLRSKEELRWLAVLDQKLPVDSNITVSLKYGQIATGRTLRPPHRLFQCDLNQCLTKVPKQQMFQCSPYHIRPRG